MDSFSRNHPILEQAARVLKSLPASPYEIYFQRKASTRIEAKNQKVDTLSRAEDAGLSIRILRDNRMGFSYTTSLEPLAVERAIHSAWEIAGFMPEDEHHALPQFEGTALPVLQQIDTTGLGLPLERKIDRALELEALCRAADPRITGIRSASLSESRYEIALLDSSGTQLQYQGSMYSASITCKAEQDGDNQMGYASTHSTQFANLDLQKLAKQATGRATEKLGATAAPTQTCPAIIRSEAMAQLLSFLAGSFSAEQVEKGRSMLSGMLREKVFSEKVRLVDDGTRPGGVATSPFDGEGTPSKRTILVESGQLHSYLYDGYYARKHGRESTANAGRSIKSPPGISTTNFFLEAGIHPLDSLVRQISSGVVITDLMGVHTANSVTGDFSLGASGFLIKNGTMSRPIRGFAIAGNIRALFGSITELGNDLEFYGSVGSPSALVPELSVGGS